MWVTESSSTWWGLKIQVSQQKNLIETICSPRHDNFSLYWNEFRENFTQNNTNLTWRWIWCEIQNRFVHIENQIRLNECAGLKSDLVYFLSVDGWRLIDKEFHAGRLHSSYLIRILSDFFSIFTCFFLILCNRISQFSYFIGAVTRFPTRKCL